MDMLTAAIAGVGWESQISRLSPSAPRTATVADTPLALPLAAIQIALVGQVRTAPRA